MSDKYLVEVFNPASRRAEYYPFDDAETAQQFASSFGGHVKEKNDD